MTAHLYFVAPGALSDDMAPGAPVVLAGDEGRHAVTVKRMGVGEQILLADGEGLGMDVAVREDDALGAPLPGEDLDPVEDQPSDEQQEEDVEQQVEDGADEIHALLIPEDLGPA